MQTHIDHHIILVFSPQKQVKIENKGMNLPWVCGLGFEEDVERWSDFSALATPLSRSRTQEDF